MNHKILANRATLPYQVYPTIKSDLKGLAAHCPAALKWAQTLLNHLAEMEHNINIASGETRSLSISGQGYASLVTGVLHSFSLLAVDYAPPLDMSLVEMQRGTLRIPQLLTLTQLSEAIDLLSQGPAQPSRGWSNKTLAGQHMTSFQTQVNDLKRLLGSIKVKLFITPDELQSIASFVHGNRTTGVSTPHFSYMYAPDLQSWIAEALGGAR